MGVLDFIFGNKDDDLEATSTSNDDASTPLGIENVPFFQRPLGATENDTMIGFDEVGNSRFRTNFGTEYTVKYNPDQRSPREKIVDAVPVVAGAVTDYISDPFIPSKEAVKNFAYDATVGSLNELDRIMNSGTATYGDIFGLASGVGAAPRVINKVVDIAPEGDPASMTGMFLPASKVQGGKQLVDEASKMKAAGSTREDIWSKTGLWQIGDAEEWLTEIPDNKAEIALTIADAPVQTQDVQKKVRRQVGGVGLSQDEVISAKTQARIKVINLRRQVESGEIPPQLAESEIARIQSELNTLTGGGIPEYEDYVVTKQVPIAKPKLTPGNSKSTSPLDQVLSHDELFGAVRAANVTDMDNLPTAEAGRRLDSSAKENAAGVAYPDTPYNRSYTQNSNKSMISSFINAGDWITDPRNARDKIIREQMDKTDPKSVEKARAQLILSTMLHEVQHWSDSIFKSESGSGFNWKNSKNAKRAMQAEYYGSVAKVFSDNEATGIRLAEVLNSTPSGAKFINKIEQLDLSKFAPTTDELIFGRNKTALTDGTKFNPNDTGAIGGILNLFNAYRMANTQITSPELLDGNRAAFIYKLADSNELKSKTIFSPIGLEEKVRPVKYSGKGTDEDLNFRLQKAELITRILESSEGMDLYNPYVQILQGRSANIRNLTDKEIYMLEMGEAKSRLVQARRDMTPEELKNTPPWLMLDRDEQKLWNRNQYGI